MATFSQLATIRSSLPAAPVAAVKKEERPSSANLLEGLTPESLGISQEDFESLLGGVPTKETSVPRRRDQRRAQALIDSLSGLSIRQSLIEKEAEVREALVEERKLLQGQIDGAQRSLVRLASLTSEAKKSLQEAEKKAAQEEAVENKRRQAQRLAYVQQELRAGRKPAPVLSTKKVEPEYLVSARARLAQVAELTTRANARLNEAKQRLAQAKKALD